MVGPAGDELAQVYGIREPYAARRSETRGKETGDKNGEMEKEIEEQEKGRAARNGCDIAQPGCLRQARTRSSPNLRISAIFRRTPCKEIMGIMHSYTSFRLNCTLLVKDVRRAFILHPSR